MTCDRIEARMDELAREFAETHDPDVREEIYEPCVTCPAI
jgi:hypothetical protein